MKLALIIIVLPLVICCIQCDGANILGIIPTASYSHQIAFFKFWKELARKGHNVTVLTTNPQKDPSLRNLVEIDLSIGYEFLRNASQWSTPSAHKSSLQFLHDMLRLLTDATKLYLELPDVQKLIQDKNSLHFDVVLVEALFPEFLMFGELFNAPTILLSSLDPSIVVHRLFQNAYHPIVYPETYISYVGDMSFTERLLATITNALIEYIKQQYTPEKNANIIKYFGDISVPISTLMDRTKMLFISTSPVLMYPRTLSPRTIIIGGDDTTIQEEAALPNDIKTFLDTSASTIYFSLGSNAKSENLDNNTILGLIKVFSQLPYGILWKFDNHMGYKMPANVMVVPWLPQQDVLRHTNVKLFITQGGVQSLEEAIYFEKPMVGIPIYGDQLANVKKMALKGVLKVVPSKPSINPIEVQEAIEEVMNNETYIANIRHLHKINLDKPVKGVANGIWWTEYVIRHKGNLDHMIHKPGKSLPLYQYYLLDVFLFLVLLVIVLEVLIYLLCLVCYRRIKIVYGYVRKKLMDDKKDVKKED